MFFEDSLKNKYDNLDKNIIKLIELVTTDENHTITPEEKEKISNQAKLSILERILGSTNYDELKKTDLVIEAATENYELKLKILSQIDAIVSKDIIIATNTSSLSVEKMGEGLQHP
ncbi:hypothetical protein EBR43_12100, partial [bacterium]|nr:hypothetical protein [bacterium]